MEIWSSDMSSYIWSICSHTHRHARGEAAVEFSGLMKLLDASFASLADVFLRRRCRWTLVRPSSSIIRHHHPPLHSLSLSLFLLLSASFCVWSVKEPENISNRESGWNESELHVIRASYKYCISAEREMTLIIKQLLFFLQSLL